MANTNNQNKPDTQNVSGQQNQDAPQGGNQGDGNQSGPEMVQIPKAELDKLMGLIPAVEQLQKDNKALSFAADRAKIEIFNERQKEPGNRTVKLSTYLADDGKRKVVMAWVKVPGGEVFKHENGSWVDTQKMELIFEDDTKKELPLLVFYRNTADKIKAEVIADQGDSFKVRTPEGKEYLIGKMFVN